MKPLKAVMYFQTEQKRFVRYGFYYGDVRVISLSIEKDSLPRPFPKQIKMILEEHKKP